MANAAADKFKALAIRHGEKAVVGLAAALFLVFAALAIIHPTLEMNPKELSTSADNAQSNINKPQDRKDILAKIEQDGIVDPGFEKIVSNQFANALKPDDYRARLEWVTPEPGAGLIRDQPEIVKPTDLAAFPGRGGMLIYKLDENGNRVPDLGADPAKAPARKKNNKRSNSSFSNSSNSGSSNSGMGMNMPGGFGGPPSGGDSPQDKKRRELEEEKRKKAMVGAVDAAKEKDKAAAKGAGGDPGSPDPNVPAKEELKGKRWVVITGVIDNAQMNKNWLLALKNPAIAYPKYHRLDVQRSLVDPDGNWTDWAMVDQKKNWDVIDNLPMTDTEYVPEPRRPSAIVDELPFLKAGFWTGVHVAKLVPSDALATGGAPSGPGAGNRSGADFPGSSSSAGASIMPGGGKSMGMPGGKLNGPGSSSMMSGSGSSIGGVSVGDTGAADEVVPPNNEPAVMLRSLDFTVERNMTYKFRVRIVCDNPNKGHADVNPGVDTDSELLNGPWSDPTDPVVVPDDVAAYAQAPEPNPRRDDLVNFQVIRWDPQTGQTVIKTDEAGPGELVGEHGSVQMPSSEGAGAKPVNIDFNSRSIVLDTDGGRELIPDIGVERVQVTVPAMALLVQPDGSVVVRNQARDRADDVRQDMEENYAQAIKDSGAARKSGGSKKIGGGRSGGRKKKGKRR